jgi:hypothetical protein
MMTLRDLLETTSRFQKVDVLHGQERITGTSQSLLSCLNSRQLDSSVVEIKADKFETLLVDIGD